MQLGVTFPQVEAGTEPAAVRDYAQAVEALGYDYLLAYDHVIGADTSLPARQGRRWPYTAADAFYEPLALFAFVAGVTRRLGLAAGVIILPQRQTVLVAKQAAVVDVLSGGRLRLGIGIGWNDVEYEALGEDFHARGRRFGEQIAVLRALWTQELVTFAGHFHRITAAGLNPLPVQRPIPLWIGGSQREGVAPVLRRIGRLADGWTLVGPPGEHTAANWAQIKVYARQAGRDPATLGLEGGISLRQGGPDEWRRTLDTWRTLGASHVCLNTMGAGRRFPDGHIELLRRARAALVGGLGA